ncbi:hypothetical protein O3P69_015678 [Scylla paramamosain]|uniref:Uncharacterized protein n=1 Tax=Scylla paramamosain TaxID=85552 RepID=A0AAW0SFK6_SCYPA
MIPGQCASLCLHPHATMRSHLFVPLVNPFVPKPHGVYVVLQEPQPRVRDISAGRSRTKIVVGWLVTRCVTTAWVGATHLIRLSSQCPLQTPPTPPPPPLPPLNTTVAPPKQREVFHAPFFTTRFCTAWTGLFCLLCLACHSCFRRDKDSLKVKTIAQNFRDRGVTFNFDMLIETCPFIPRGVTPACLPLQHGRLKHKQGQTVTSKTSHQPGTLSANSITANTCREITSCRRRPSRHHASGRTITS